MIEILCEEPTVETQVDLSAFEHERPTSKTIDGFVPLDAIPVLTETASGEVDLSPEAAAVVRRIDGTSTLMQMTEGGWISPAEASRLLGQLVREGVAKLR